MNKLKKFLKNKHAKLFVVRHGETDRNHTDKSKDRIRGWDDVPLNANGIKDAQRAGKELKNEDISKIYSSDLVRASVTAREINKDHDVPIHLSMAFRPWNLGVLTGKITADVLPEMQQLVKHEEREVKDGESFKEFKHRYLSALIYCMAKALSRNTTIVVVAHYRNMVVTQAWVDEGMRDDFYTDHEKLMVKKVDTGGIYQVPLYDEDRD